MDEQKTEDTSTASSSNHITLHIRSHFYVGSYTITVKPLCLIKDIKTAVVVSYYGPMPPNNTFAMDKLISYHRLIGPRKTMNTYNNRLLRDGITIIEARLENQDELYLLRSLPPLTPLSKPKTARQLEIDELQDHMLEKEIKKEMKKSNIIFDQKNNFITAIDANEFQAPEFFSDMRRIITVYLEVVFTTLCGLSISPPVDQMLTTLRNHFLYTLYPVALNPAFVIECREMGYSANRAKYAFHMTKHRNNEAMEWLKTHKSITSLDIPDETVYQNEIELARNELQAAPLNDLDLLLELFRQYREYTFKPDMFATNNLKEMGYKMDDITLALKQAENSFPAAFRILSGDKSASLTNMTFLTYPNRLYQSMMERLLRNHILDLKVMIALLSFYREPEKIIFGWCWNREIAPIIFEMFETYNLEILDLYHCDRKYGSAIASSSENF